MNGVYGIGSGGRHSKVLYRLQYDVMASEKRWHVQDAAVQLGAEIVVCSSYVPEAS